MRVIPKRTLREFWQSSRQYADAQGPIEAWHAEISKAAWRTPQEVKAQFRSASILKGSRAVFNIAGKLYGLPNVCPHQTGPLCEGKPPLGTLVTRSASRCPSVSTARSVYIFLRSAASFSAS
jgi:mRNA interferase HigB